MIRYWGWAVIMPPMLATSLHTVVCALCALCIVHCVLCTVYCVHCALCALCKCSLCTVCSCDHVAKYWPQLCPGKLLLHCNHSLCNTCICRFNCKDMFFSVTTPVPMKSLFSTKAMIISAWLPDQYRMKKTNYSLPIFGWTWWVRAQAARFAKLTSKSKWAGEPGL